MNQIIEKPWFEQRVCAHGRTSWAILETTKSPQIRKTCIDCGHRLGGAAPKRDHPHAAD